MKESADQWLKPMCSVAGTLADTTITGISIDCKDFEEALAYVQTGQFSGTDPVCTVKWQSSPNDSDWTDISGAVHDAVKLDPNLIVVSVDLTNIALTVAAQPTNPARIQAIVTDSTSTITVGTLTIVGTRPPVLGEIGNQAITEALTFTEGATKKTNGYFTTVTSVTASAFATLGGSSDETIVVGTENSGPLTPHMGRLNLTQLPRYLRAVATITGTTPVGEVVASLILSGAQDFPVVPVVPSEFSV